MHVRHTLLLLGAALAAAWLAPSPARAEGPDRAPKVLLSDFGSGPCSQSVIDALAERDARHAAGRPHLRASAADRAHAAAILAEAVSLDRPATPAHAATAGRSAAGSARSAGSRPRSAASPSRS